MKWWILPRRAGRAAINNQSRTTGAGLTAPGFSVWNVQISVYRAVYDATVGAGFQPARRKNLASMDRFFCLHFTVFTDFTPSRCKIRDGRVTNPPLHWVCDKLQFCLALSRSFLWGAAKSMGFPLNWPRHSLYNAFHHQRGGEEMKGMLWVWLGALLLGVGIVSLMSFIS